MKTISFSIVFFLIFLLLSSGLISIDYYSWRSYDININREIQNETEEVMLNIAENADYSFILNRSRFWGDQMNISTDHYSEPKYIDDEVINSLADQIRYRKEKSYRGNSYMEYNAKVQYIESLTISLYISEHGYQKIKFTTDENIFNYRYRYDTYFEDLDLISFKNGSIYDLYNSSYDKYPSLYEKEMNFSNCFIIIMELSYGVQTYPLAGSGYDLDQVLIIDQHNEILAVHVTTSEWVS